MKIKDPMLNAIRKEYRKFDKYAKDHIYSFHGFDDKSQEDYLEENIREIIKNYDIVRVKK